MFYENKDIKLNNFNIIENKKLHDNEEKDKFYNLSLKQIFINLSNTLILIINDIIDIDSKSKNNIKLYIDILFKDDRIIYVGIFLIFISIILYL